MVRQLAPPGDEGLGGEEPGDAPSEYLRETIFVFKTTSAVNLSGCLLRLCSRVNYVLLSQTVNPIIELTGTDLSKRLNACYTTESVLISV